MSTGMAAITAAEGMAKSRGGKLLAWDHDTGQEFIRVGAGDRPSLAALEQDLVREGWQVWAPKDPDVLQRDFSRYPPGKEPPGRLYSEVEARDLPPPGDYFRYRGLGKVAIFWTGPIVSVAVMSRASRGHGVVSPEISLIALVSGLIATVALVVAKWMVVTGDGESLRVRRFGRVREFRWPGVRNVRLVRYDDTQERYVSLELEKGATYEIPAAPAYESALLSFIKSRIRS